MGMNNVYYRFVHLASNKQYGTLPAKLRMNIIANPGVDKTDFELWSLAVSAINGCGMCIDAHEAVLLKAGMPVEQIQTARALRRDHPVGRDRPRGRDARRLIAISSSPFRSRAAPRGRRPFSCPPSAGAGALTSSPNWAIRQHGRHRRRSGSGPLRA